MRVLFVCFGNVGRSQLAKGFYNLFTKSSAADSAGTANDADFPIILAEKMSRAEKEHPEFFAEYSKSMLGAGVNMATAKRQRLTQEMLSGGGYDLIVNIAERNQTPAWFRGGNVIWWDIEDPGNSKTVESWLMAHDEIERRVKRLIEIEKTSGDFHELDDDIDGGEND